MSKDHACRQAEKAIYTCVDRMKQGGAQTSRSLSLNDLKNDIYENAKAHGWHDKERSFGEIIALCHSELSEALEEYRNGKQVNDMYFEGDKPCGIPIELADVIIRILDYCGKEGIDIERAIYSKHAYNKGRSYRHGHKVI